MHIIIEIVAQGNSNKLDRLYIFLFFSDTISVCCINALMVEIIHTHCLPLPIYASIVAFIHSYCLTLPISTEI